MIFQTGDLVRVVKEETNLYEYDYIFVWRHVDKNMFDIKVLNGPVAYGVYIQLYKFHNQQENIVWHQVLVGDQIYLVATNQIKPFDE